MKLTGPVELRGYEGSGMDGSERHLKRVWKGTTVERGFSMPVVRYVNYASSMRSSVLPCE